MSLSERIAARQCAVKDCHEDRLPDSLVCHDHIGDLWANRLDRDGDTYVPRRRFPPVDRTWDRAA